MNYLIGDVQGCFEAFERLLAELGFSPSRDRLYLLGDLVNRGPQSLAVLQRVRGLGDAAQAVLGNHDLHLLAVATGTRAVAAKDTLDDVVSGPQRAAWVDWLRQRPLAIHEHGWLMVHAGVAAPWDLQQTLQLAGEVQAELSGPGLSDLLRGMYGNEPKRWDASLTGIERLRFIVNALTRMRFCTADGALDLKGKEGADRPPAGHMPWFEVPGRRTAGLPIAFGHWSTLGLVNRPDLLGLDTGCVWGGKLTAVRIDGGLREVIQVACRQEQAPG